jgi:L-iditol 2-dehydrogenase
MADRAEMMKAVFLRGAGDLYVEDMPMPRPAAHEALVAIRAVGVCGSDMHYYEHGRVGPFVVKQPLIIGHECAGEVVEVGEGVSSLKPGDMVALEPGIPCRRCSYCLSDRYNLCPQLYFMGTPPNHGAFRQFVAWPDDFCYRLPEGVSAEIGATVEPLAVGLQACKLTGVRPGESVVVIGAGPIGLMAVTAAAAAGATSITALDMVPMRLEYALKMGATRALDASAAHVTEALEGSAHVVIDCVGVEATAAQTVALARRGGRVALVGMAGDSISLPLVRAQAKELSFHTVWRYAGVYPTAVNLLGAGRIDTAPMITHRFRFPQVAQALKFASENRATALKTMVSFE